MSGRLPARRRLGRDAALGGLVVGVLLAASACAGLPEQGAVRVRDEPSPSGTGAPFDFNPPGPQEDATAEQVVAGFLRALQATPASTAAAAEFLTPEARSKWRPDRRTVVYDGLRFRAGPGQVTVLLDGAFELDAHGRWAGRSPEPLTVPFALQREDGEWRVTAPPDASIIPRSHFTTRYRAYSLHFFDPAGSVLVPEPVYLPWGTQAPTQLVAGLLAGPAPHARGVVRSFFPRSTRLGVGVPVDDDGVAEVPLSAEVLDLDDEARQLMLAQLAWTLRQVPDVRSLRITVDGAPIDLEDGSSTATVAGWGEYNPTIASSSTDLFGIRAGAVRQVVGDTVLEAAPLAGAGLGMARSVGVDMTGQRFAVVAEDGDRVAVLTRGPDSRRVAEHATTDPLRPMWDRTGRLWLVDRGPGGATVTVGTAEGARRPVPVPGVSGRAVVAAALSRDGTRLAVLTDDGGPRVVLARVVRSTTGAPLRVSPAVGVPAAGSLRGARDLGWRDPTTLAVLVRPSASTSEVVLASADGASAAVGLGSESDLLFAAADRLAASPGGPQALLVRSPTGRLHELGSSGRWELDAVPVRLRAPTFVG